MSLIQNTQTSLPLSRDRIDKAKQDFHYSTIEATASKDFLASFIDAMSDIERWDHLVGTVILHKNRQDLLKYFGRYYDQNRNMIFDRINIIFSEEVSEEEIFLISDMPTDNYQYWTDGWITSSMRILTKEEAMIKDIIT